MPTVERQVTIDNQLGLHVRPAAQLATTAMRFQAAVWLLRDGQTINAKSSLELLTLAAVRGTVLTVRAQGNDAEAAVTAIVDLIESRFGEER
jgi:phosphocarrier protein